MSLYHALASQILHVELDNTIVRFVILVSL